MSRIMAIDYGDARTGVALSDVSGTLVGQAQTLTLTGKKLVAAIVDMAGEHQVDTVVVGLPRNMDGSYGFRAEITQTFADKLRVRGLTVVLRDERLTTVSAHNILSTQNKRGDKRKGLVDSVAAGLILQEYLDYQKQASE